jgi:hypothetical protein
VKYRIRICAEKIYFVFSYANKLSRRLIAIRIEINNKIKVEYFTLCRKWSNVTKVSAL